MPRNARKSQKSPIGRAPLSARLGARARVEINHSIDRLMTNGAEGHVVPGKHDAVQLGTKIALGLVIRALESAHLAGVFFGGEDPRFLNLLLAKQRIHLVFVSPVGPYLFVPFFDFRLPLL